MSDHKHGAPFERHCDECFDLLIRGRADVGTTQPSTECDERLRLRGVGVLVIANLASTAVEAQVVRWREELKVPLDWHYVGGRAVVKCRPADVEKVGAHLHDFSVQVMAVPL